jgi:hypothetical protein
MVLIVFFEDDLEHVVKERILFVCLCNLGAWLQVGGLVFDAVRDGLLDDFFAKGNQRLATSCVELVLKVAKGLTRDLHVALDKVTADPWVKFIKVRPEDDVVLALEE